MSSIAHFESLAHAWSGFMWAMTWQCGVVVAAVWLLTLCARKARASLRYALWCLVLAKLLLLPTFRLPVGLGDVTHRAGLKMDWPQKLRAQSGEPRRTVITDGEASPLVKARQASPAPVGRDASFTVWLLLGWAATCAILALALLVRHLRIRSAVRSAQAPEQTELVTLFRECLEAAGARGRIDLKVSNHFPSPVALGIWRPTILLPSCVLREVRMDAQSLRPILLHELAHIRRRDLWINWLQTLLQIVYFFHPGVWLANHFLRREREKACDEQVLAWLGYDRDPSVASRSYAEILLRVVELMPGRTPFALGFVSVAEPQGAVADRIREILKGRSRLVPRLGLVGLLVVAAVAVVILPLAREAESGRPPQHLPTHEQVASMPMPAQAGSVVKAGDGNTAYIAQFVDRSTGLPLVAVRASLRPESQRKGITATTDRDGRFAVTGLTPGRYRLRHEAEDYVRLGKRAAFTLVEDKGETAARIIRLDRGAIVRGVALLPSGKPAARVRLSLDVSMPRHSYGGYDHATTDGEGRFEFRGIPACVAAVTSGGGERLYAAWRDSIALGEVRERVVLQLHERNVTVTGKVVDATGAPVAKARAGLGIRLGSGGSFNSFSAGTIADGTFVIEDAPPGTFTLRGSFGSLLSSNSIDVVLSDGERAGPFTLKLHGSVSRGPQVIRGRVVDAQGEPVSAARVCILESSVRCGSGSQSHCFGRWTKKRTITTDSAGSFVLKIEEPMHTHHILLADAPAFGPVLLEGVRTGAEDVLLKLEPSATLKGRITSAQTARPLAGTPIRLSHVKVSRFGSTTHIVRTQYLDQLTRTDARGYYDAQGLAAGEYRLEVAMDGSPMAPSDPVRLEPGQVLSLDWQARPHAQRTITVVDATDGRPVAGVELSESGRSFATTDARGTVRISDKKYHSLRLRATGYVPLEIDAGPGNPAFRTLKRIELTRAAKLSVEVRDERGQPLPNVFVSVQLLGKKPRDFGHPQGGTTGASGTVVLDSLPPGLKLQLSAEPKGYPRCFSGKMKLDPDAQNPVAEIVARPGATLRVKVLDTEDNEISRVQMGVMYKVAWRKYSAWGTKPYAGQQPFVISGVATKPFKLVVRANGFTETTIEGDALRVKQIQDLEVRVGAGNTLSGTLTDEAGKPKPDVGLRIWTYASGEPRAGNTATDANGRFVMRGLGAGPVSFDVNSSPWFALRPQTGRPRFTAASNQSHSVRLLGAAR